MENDLQRKRFLRGVALAWAPWVPAIVGLGPLFRGISGSKATGAAVVVVGFAEMYILIGLAATLFCELCAMTLLFRAFSRGHPLRATFSAISIGMSGLMIFLFCLSVWLFWIQNHRGF